MTHVPARTGLARFLFCWKNIGRGMYLYETRVCEARQVVALFWAATAQVFFPVFYLVLCLVDPKEPAEIERDITDTLTHWR